jgi:dihydroorotase
MSSGLLLRGGTVVDPACDLCQSADVRVQAGIVTDVGRLVPEGSERIIDVDELIVAPGFIDVHVHLREPGLEWKETVGSGTAAAAAGGFSTVFCMPNTEPALDSVVSLKELRRRTDRDAAVRVFPIAAISEGRRGDLAVDYDALAEAGAVGFSDDGESTKSCAVMQQALEASRRVNLPVMVQCEEPTLTGGSMHAGDTSRELGIQGLPAEAEELVIERDLALAKATGGWLHLCHVSTAGGVKSIADAKQRGTAVTAEAMPHHLTMTDEWVAGCYCMVNATGIREHIGEKFDSRTKVNPPLRTAVDARALLEGIKTGTIDVVSTDHAPHSVPEKQGRTFPGSAFGLSGSEFALPLMLALVRAGHFGLEEVIRLLSTMPARLWRLRTGTLKPGSPADIVVFDPNEKWIAEENRLMSRGMNTPLLHRELIGRAKLTLIGGDERYRGF